MDDGGRQCAARAWCWRPHRGLAGAHHAHQEQAGPAQQLRHLQPALLRHRAAQTLPATSVPSFMDVCRRRDECRVARGGPPRAEALPPARWRLREVTTTPSLRQGDDIFSARAEPVILEATLEPSCIAYKWRPMTWWAISVRPYPQRRAGLAALTLAGRTHHRRPRAHPSTPRTPTLDGVGTGRHRRATAVPAGGGGGGGGARWRRGLGAHHGARHKLRGSC